MYPFSCALMSHVKLYQRYEHSCMRDVASAKNIKLQSDQQKCLYFKSTFLKILMPFFQLEADMHRSNLIGS